MASFLPDDIDYAAYEAQTDAKVAIREARIYADEVRAAFAVKDGVCPHPTVTSSSKLADRLHFRPGETTVWAGYNGHRKSMFTGQVALDLMSQGQKVLIASMEMQPAKTIERMAMQATAKRFPSPAQQDRFMGWTDKRLWIFDHMGHVSPQRLMGVCRYFAQEMGGQHAFIDSMMMVCESEESLDAQKRFTTDVVRLGLETGLHLHLIAHCRKPHNGSEDLPPTKYEIKGTSSITDQSPNVITVWANKGKEAELQKTNPDRGKLEEEDAVISVAKQRNGDWEGKVGLWFDRTCLRFTERRMERSEPYPMETA